MEGREAPDPGRFIADHTAIKLDPRVSVELLVVALHPDPDDRRAGPGADDHPFEGHRANQTGGTEYTVIGRPVDRGDEPGELGSIGMRVGRRDPVHGTEQLALWSPAHGPERPYEVALCNQEFSELPRRQAEQPARQVPEAGLRGNRIRHAVTTN